MVRHTPVQREVDLACTAIHFCPIRELTVAKEHGGDGYLAHPVLAGRLRECCQILLGLETSSALEVFGTPDDLKRRSCMTLFSEASREPGSVFDGVLHKLFGGQKDPRTLELLR